jgi:hypothetical protein
VGVVTVKVAPVCPDVTTTKAGIWATNGLLVLRFTTKPAAGAGAEIVTVPVEVLPPVTVAGLSVRLTGVGSPAGFTVSVVDAEAAA